MRLLLYTSFLLLLGCNTSTETKPVNSAPKEKSALPNTPFLIVLGTVQDAGSPHIGCKKDCCKDLFKNPDPNRQVVSLGLIEPVSKSTYLFEATPDISRQTKKLKSLVDAKQELPDGIFLTHAHIGHYSGLMYLGKEATNAQNVPVYAMPKMKEFLASNGPWDQLVNTGNILITELQEDSEVLLDDAIFVTPFLVPHRDEYSETVGYVIKGASKKALFIPDIDKWEKWETSVLQVISEVDYAFLDATFYDGEEINNRDISQIPHPFIIESMELFKSLPAEEKSKVYFIHFNHTNPVLDTHSEAYRTILNNGFNVAEIDQIFRL